VDYSKRCNAAPACAIDSEGRILAVLYRPSNSGNKLLSLSVARLSSTGSFDSTWGTDGVYDLPSSALTIIADGHPYVWQQGNKVLVKADNGTNTISLLRLNQ